MMERPEKRLNRNFTTEEWKDLLQKRRDNLDSQSRRVIKRIVTRRKKIEHRMMVDRIIIMFSLLLIVLLSLGILPKV